MKKRSSAIAKAKYDVDAGRKISHQTVKKIVKKEYRGPEHRKVNDTYNKMAI